MHKGTANCIVLDIVTIPKVVSQLPTMTELPRRSTKQIEANLSTSSTLKHPNLKMTFNTRFISLETL